MNDFDRSSASAISGIMAAIDAAELDCDVEQKGDGVLEITMANGSRIIVNRQSAAGELWIAARSGGYHFRQEGGEWICTRSRQQLMDVLERCMGEQAGQTVSLRG